MAIESPDVSFNKGFADLGQGFYLTDDHDAAVGRAQSRARVDGTGQGAVSAYELDESAIRWVTLGAGETQAQAGAGEAQSTRRSGGFLGVQFAETQEGVAAWANYIKACRKGHTDVAGVGEPDVVRAWIATEDVEMVCSGFAPAEVLAEFIDPHELVVQYCLRNQEAIDGLLEFTGAEAVGDS